VSSIASVFAYDYDPATGKVGTKKAVITGMSIPGPYHLTRTLRIPKSHPDILFVQRGSDGNIDTTAVQASSGKSQLRIFNISSILATPVAYASSGTLLGMGLRNSVGWAQHPITNHIVRSSLLWPSCVLKSSSGQSRTQPTTSRRVARTFTRTILRKSSTSTDSSMTAPTP